MLQAGSFAIVEKRLVEYNEFRKQTALEFSKIILSDIQHRTINGDDAIKAAVYLANKLVEELENSRPNI